MSTPLSDLPQNLEEMEENEIDVPQMRKGLGGYSGFSFFKNNKDLFFVFLAVIAGSYVPLDSFRYSVPQQVFALGDGPINAIVVVVLFAVFRIIFKNISS